MIRLVLLDNEAVQAVRDLSHRKHRQVVSLAQVVSTRKRSGAAIDVEIPAAVRVEAGWDRTSPTWAFPSRLRIADIPLGAIHSSLADAIRDRTGVSVADAHLGAVVRSSRAEQITVVTSDPGDMRRVAGDRIITVAVI
jgi:hypothetical protein